MLRPAFFASYSAWSAAASSCPLERAPFQPTVTPSDAVIGCPHRADAVSMAEHI